MREFYSYDRNKKTNYRSHKEQNNTIQRNQVDINRMLMSAVEYRHSFTMLDKTKSRPNDSWKVNKHTSMDMALFLLLS